VGGTQIVLKKAKPFTIYFLNAPYNPSNPSNLVVLLVFIELLEFVELLVLKPNLTRVTQ
jgi:hypothetical protein